MDYAGMLSDKNSSQRPNCLVFIRNLNNVNLQHTKAKRFIDLIEDDTVYEEKQGRSACLCADV